MKNHAEDPRTQFDQRSFLPPAAVTDALRIAAERFWDAEDKFLDGMQAFLDGWFARRHEGTRSAMAAARRMYAAESVTDFAREYQEWANDALRRLTADGTACQQAMGGVLSGLSKSMPLADGGNGEGRRRAPTARARPTS